MHIELTEMLRCPEPHPQAHLVLSTAEMVGRSVRSGMVGCPVCRREFRIINGIVDFGRAGSGQRSEPVRAPGDGLAPPATAPRSPLPASSDRPPLPAPQVLQALLDLSGPGGIVALVGQAARYGEGLAGLMAGIHFVGINGPVDLTELPVLSLAVAPDQIPLRDASVRGVVVGADAARAPWLGEAVRVLLRGRRLVIEGEDAAPPGVTRRAAGDGLWVGEKA